MEAGGRWGVPPCHHWMREIMDEEQSQVKNKENLTLEEVLAAQPLNPLRPLEFRVLPLKESNDN